MLTSVDGPLQSCKQSGMYKRSIQQLFQKPYQWWGEIIALKLVGLILSIRSCLPGTDDTSSLKIELWRANPLKGGWFRVP